MPPRLEGIGQAPRGERGRGVARRHDRRRARCRWTGAPDDVPESTGECARRAGRPSARRAARGRRRRVRPGAGGAPGGRPASSSASRPPRSSCSSRSGAWSPPACRSLTALFGLGISGSLVGVLAAVTDVPDWAPSRRMIGPRRRHRLRAADPHPYRERRWPAGASHARPPSRRSRTAGRSVLVAGATVVISLLGLFLMGLPYLYGVRSPRSSPSLVVMVAAVTLLPALLGFVGPAYRPAAHPGAGRAPARPGATPAARWAAACSAARPRRRARGRARCSCSRCPVTGLRLGFPDAGNDRGRHDHPRGIRHGRPGFGPGANGPLLVVAEHARRRPTAPRCDRWRGHRATSPASRRSRPCSANAAGDAAMVTVTPDDVAAGRRDGGPRPRLRDGAAAASGLRDVARRRRHRGRPSTRARRRRTACRCSSAASSGCRSCCCSAAFRAPLVALKAGGDEPAVDRRGLRRRRAARRGRLGRAARRHRHRRPRCRRSSPC